MHSIIGKHFCHVSSARRLRLNDVPVSGEIARQFFLLLLGDEPGTAEPMEEVFLVYGKWLRFEGVRSTFVESRKRSREAKELTRSVIIPCGRDI